MLVGAVNAAEPAQLLIELDLENPAESRCKFLIGEDAPSFAVGFGRNGVIEEGGRFQGGFSLLGTFRVNAILAPERFEMKPELVETSGKTEAYLREQLFSNMSSIDFDGDGKGGEYGAGFIGLEPLSETAQPFSFQAYKGVFRLYSYAIHGTQDEARIGKKITGGCINVGAADLQQLLARVKLGDLVVIRAKK